MNKIFGALLRLGVVLVALVILAFVVIGVLSVVSVRGFYEWCSGF